jgi:helicase MOV-10
MIPIVAFSNANTNVVLAGDPNQLGPIIKPPSPGSRGLGRSYLQRLMFMRDVYRLDTQLAKT